MFKAGKKYKRCDKAYSEYLYECVYSDKEYGVLKNHRGYGAPFVTSAPYMYEEYKEPRTIVGYVNVWKDPDGSIRFGNQAYKEEREALRGCSSGERLCVHKIEYTESN